MSKLIWLFDLDNTLHDASHAIFPAINANMNAYIASILGKDGAPADPETVNAAREAYWRRYGATLLGMVKHHGVRQEDFLREAHRFGNLAAMIRAERGLGRLLKRLPGRKILLTNAPRRYSHDVLRHLGLHRYFAKHIPIESMTVHRQLRPKPSRLMLRRLLAAEGAHAGNCILVEDTVATLKAAKALGVRTVWVTGYLGAQPDMQRQDASKLPHKLLKLTMLTKSTKRPAYVDVKVKSVRQIPNYLHRLS